MMKRRLFTAIMAAAVSMSALAATSAGVNADWVKSDSGYSYKDDSTGKKLTGWQTIDGNKYYFDKKGYALTGWKKIGDNTYYFNASKKGKMLTGWNTISGSKYYFGTDGVMRTGFIKLSGKTYYFGNDGAMRTGKLKISGKTYDFGTDGVLKTSSSSSSETSTSTIAKPFKGLSWNLDMDSLISKANLKDYYIDNTVLFVGSGTPYTYYYFGKNGKLAAYGYFTDKNNYSAYNQLFKDEGWKKTASHNGDGESDYKNAIYKKGKSLAQVYYYQGRTITYVFSDTISKAVINGGDISDYIDF